MVNPCLDPGSREDPAGQEQQQLWGPGKELREREGDFSQGEVNL